MKLYLQLRAFIAAPLSAFLSYYNGVPLKFVEEEARRGSAKFDDQSSFRNRRNARIRINHRKRPPRQSTNWHVNCFRRAANSAGGMFRIARGIGGTSHKMAINETFVLVYSELSMAKLKAR